MSMGVTSVELHGGTSYYLVISVFLIQFLNLLLITRIKPLKGSRLRN